MIGRRDGTIEVHSFEDGEEAEPVLKWSGSCGESVTSLEGGVVSHQGYQEIVAATYTGKVVFSLSHQHQCICAWRRCFPTVLCRQAAP